VGTNGIASDDSEAIEKLKDKLTSLEKSQETMKAVNKVVRSNHMTDNDKVEYIVKTQNLTEAQAKEVLKPDFAGRVGFADYSLKNNNANIRNTRDRIEQLTALHNQAPLSDSGEVEGVAWTLYEDDGRIKFKFDGKPSENFRGKLKVNGFKWSRFSMAWVRKITPNAVAVTKRFVISIKEMNNS
jgi:hypothetical protein